MKLQIIACLTICCFRITVDAVAQTIIYDNIRPENTYGGSVGLQWINLEPYVTAYRSVAVPFVVPTNYDIAIRSVEVAVQSADDWLGLSLLKDNNGLPGSMLDMSFVNLRQLRGQLREDSVPLGIVNFSFSNSILSKGEKYWVTLPFSGPGIGWALSASNSGEYAFVELYLNGSEGYMIPPPCYSMVDGRVPPFPGWSMVSGLVPTLRVTATAIPELESTGFVVLATAGAFIAWKRKVYKGIGHLWRGR